MSEAITTGVFGTLIIGAVLYLAAQINRIEDRLSRRIDHLADRIDAVSDRIDALSERVARIEGRLDEREHQQP